MKSPLLAILICSAGYAGGAYAQSDVTLYGVIDAGISYVSNAGGHPALHATSGDVQGSHWGLIGAESLGGATRAIFRLEGGFNVMTGGLTQSNRAFGYQSWAGVANARWGSVTLGRQYDSVVDFLAPAHKPVSNNLAAHVYDNDNLNHGFRVNNAVKYRYGEAGPWSVSGLYGFSNDAGFANDRVWSVGTSWRMGSLKLAAAYLQLNNAAGGNANGAVTLSDRTFIAARQRTYGAGATYTSGAATLGLLWTHSQFDELKTINGIGALGIAVGNARARFDNVEANVLYRFTPALSATGTYTYTRARFDRQGGTYRPDWHELSLLLDYALSRRTDVYVDLLYQRANADGSGLNANINRQSPASGGTQTVVALGMRQRF